MAMHEVQEQLKNMSGDELAQAQNAIILAPDLHPKDRMAAMEIISMEVATRQAEGLGRKAGRFWNRHGEKIGILAIGALLGDWIGD